MKNNVLRVLLKGMTFLFCMLIMINCKKDSDGDQGLILADGTMKDIDGNVYKTVKIGDQIWMASNLATTRLKDNTAIPLVEDDNKWNFLLTSGYCWYNNDAMSNKVTYGALYNWNTVSTGKLCPSGWHVPTDAQLTTLITNLGGLSNAGGQLKETGTIHWELPNTLASDKADFAALPAGARLSDGYFSGIGENGSWWSSTESLTTTQDAWAYTVLYDDGAAYRSLYEKFLGLSVRCLKD